MYDSRDVSDTWHNLSIIPIIPEGTSHTHRYSGTTYRSILVNFGEWYKYVHLTPSINSDIDCEWNTQGQFGVWRTQVKY